jgi:hypothetical protein
LGSGEDSPAAFQDVSRGEFKILKIFSCAAVHKEKILLAIAVAILAKENFLCRHGGYPQ